MAAAAGGGERRVGYKHMPVRWRHSDGSVDDGGDGETGRRVVPRLAMAKSNADHAAMAKAAHALGRLPHDQPESKMYVAVELALRDHCTVLSGESIDLIRYIKAARPTMPPPKRFGTPEECLVHVTRSIGSCAMRGGVKTKRLWGSAQSQCFVDALLKFGETMPRYAILSGYGLCAIGHCEDDNNTLELLAMHVPTLAEHLLRVPDVSNTLRTLGDLNENHAVMPHLFAKVATQYYDGCPGDRALRRVALAILNTVNERDLNDGRRHPLLHTFFDAGVTPLFRDVLDACVELDGTRMRLIGPPLRGCYDSADELDVREIRLDDFKVEYAAGTDSRHKSRLADDAKARAMINSKIHAIRMWCREVHRVVVAAFDGQYTATATAGASATGAGVGKNMWSVVALYALHPTLHATALETGPLAVITGEPVEVDEDDNGCNTDDDWDALGEDEDEDDE